MMQIRHAQAAFGDGGRTGKVGHDIGAALLPHRAHNKFQTISVVL
jgi:hypothetical protein